MSSEKSGNPMESRSVQAFVSNFFSYYYTDRDLDKVMSCFHDDVIFVGLEANQTAFGKEEARKIVRQHLTGIPNSIPYFLMDYRQNRQENGTWNCFASVEFNVVSSRWGTVRYDLRITFSVCACREGWKITAAHASEPSVEKNDHEFHYRCREARSTAERELGRIMSQIVPGGIVSCSVNAGAAVSIVNVECLRMLHYPTFYDFMEACGGRYENIIHPDDVEKYRSAVIFITTQNKQCELDYRIRCREGHYIWVHSIGRRARSTDGADLIVSVLIDTSSQVEHQKQLESEIDTDPLTSVYNRRGAEKKLKSCFSGYQNFAAFLLDVDNFKLVNDLYGHKTGDAVLRYLAGLLFARYGEKGIVCRHGGDEFSIFLTDCPGREVLQTDMQKICRAFNDHLQRICPKAHASLSVGGVCGKPPLRLNEVMDQADCNMYRIKRDEKNGICLTQFPDSF